MGERTTTGRRRRGPTTFLIVALALVVVACLLAPVAGLVIFREWRQSGVKSGPILKAQTLQQYPEYTLYYPGATLLGQGGKDAENGPFFYSRASSGATMGTDDSQEAVLAFYERELIARGWQRSDLDKTVGTAELATYAWRKGYVVFRLAFHRKNDPRNLAIGDQYTTPYDFRLIADDPRDPGWKTAP